MNVSLGTYTDLLYKVTNAKGSYWPNLGKLEHKKLIIVGYKPLSKIGFHESRLIINEVGKGKLFFY